MDKITKHEKMKNETISKEEILKIIDKLSSNDAMNLHRLKDVVGVEELKQQIINHSPTDKEESTSTQKTEVVNRKTASPFSLLEQAREIQVKCNANISIAKEFLGEEGFNQLLEFDHEHNELKNQLKQIQTKWNELGKLCYNTGFFDLCPKCQEEKDFKDKHDKEMQEIFKEILK